MFLSMERKTGLEPATPTLARLCSTTELLPHNATVELYHLQEICQAIFLLSQKNFEEANCSAVRLPLTVNRASQLYESLRFSRRIL